MRGLRSVTTALLACVAGVLGASLGASAQADDEIGTGTYLASGSKITTGINTLFASVEDKDLYVFDGFVGQKVTVTITVPSGKSGTLIPFLEVFRPDQSPVTIADGAKFTPKPGPSLSKPKLMKFSYKLNQTGVWTIRVRGGFPGMKVFDDLDTPLVNEGDDPKTGGKIETSHLEYDYGLAGANRTKGQYTIAISYSKTPPASKRNAQPGEDGLYRFYVPATGGAKMSGLLTFKGGTPIFDRVLDPAGTDLLIVPSYARVKPGQSITLTNVPLPTTSPPGTYTVLFRAPTGAPATQVSFNASLKMVKAEKPLKSKFSTDEPTIETLDRTEGGPGVTVTVTCLGISDPAKRSGKPRVFLDRIEMKLDSVNTVGLFTYIKFTTPTSSLDFPDGVYDLRVASSAGQTATRLDAFTVVPPPVIESLDPTSASEAGNFLVTIRGSNFSTASTTAMRIRYVGVDDQTLDVTTAIPMIPPLSPTVIRYLHPLKGQGLNLGHGEFYVEVENYATGRRTRARQTLTLASAATINRVTPTLIPILGGEMIYVKGANFADTDRVYLEKTPNSPGVVPDDYDDMTALAPTFQSGDLHQFAAPPRPKGTYRVFVRDGVNGYDTPTRTFSYYQLADFTPNLGLNGSDGYDAYSTALADYNPANPKDSSPSDRVDLFLTRKGGDTIGATSQTRVFRNDGNGAMTDVTATVMPAVTADEDWRGDRIVVTDIDLDGFNDMVLATNSDKFPLAGAKSHVRILLNEPKGSGAQGERVFRDHTAELMAPMRKMNTLYCGSNCKNESDDWRAQDMYVGDVDFSNKTPPEIVIVNDQVFENYYVSCTPYCASPYASGYTYSFYFGGLRLFKWDQSARSGLGRYKYDAAYFPRASGITVPIFNPPPGVTVPTCKPNQCRGTFTPFTGQRLAVGDINYDPSRPATAKPDFAVVNNQPVTREGVTISSLQIALNEVGIDGTNVTDVTKELAGVDSSGDYFKSDAVAIGHPSYEGVDTGVIAVAKASPQGLVSSAIRLIRYRKPGAGGGTDFADFDDIANAVMPATTPNDRFQSSRIAFIDVDGDGDEDMVTVANAAPGGNNPAFRIFRNDVAAAPKFMVYSEALRGLVVGDAGAGIPSLPLNANGYYDGTSLAIGDLNGDGAVDYVITRATTVLGAGPHTRAIKTDK